MWKVVSFPFNFNLSEFFWQVRKSCERNLWSANRIIIIEKDNYAKEILILFHFRIQE